MVEKKVHIKSEDVTMVPGLDKLLEKAEKEGIETAFHRFAKQQPQCRFGLLGICCRNCAMGPCRINPFGGEPSRGVCGADADTIVARNLVRMIAAGAAAHSDHARDILFVFRDVVQGKNKSYRITDAEKLKWIASKLGVKIADRDIMEIGEDVTAILEKEFGKQDEETLALVKAFVPARRIAVWAKAGILPRNIDREIVEIMHRTHMGVDADPLSLIAAGARAALADGWSGSMMATLLSDVLFGTPKPLKSTANLGVLKKDHVNIIVHGHNPLLSMKIVEAARSEEMQKLAREVGAKGINVVGMCCTGNEVLMRLAIPAAGPLLMQELAIVTGAVEAIVVDYQCIMPSLAVIAQCYHTKLITTEKKARIPGAIHVEFEPERADECAKEIVKIAVENFKNRIPERVYIPEEKVELMAGFSVEAILAALGGSIKPLAEALKNGTIKGIVGIVGCNNPKVKQTYGHVELTKELIKHDILVVGTGCWALSAAIHGLLSPEAAKIAGPGLRSLCEKLGIPPAIHMGSCVDCSRILLVLAMLAEELNVDIADLPVVGSAPEWMSEKAVSIGTYFVATGVMVHLGVVPPVLGSKKVAKLLTEDLEAIVGAKFYVEPDPKKAAEAIIAYIEEKRRKLGWPV